MHQQSNLYKTLFFLYICIFSTLVVIYARHPLVIDDVWQFFYVLETKYIPLYFSPASGRFFPMSPIDLNILMHLSNSPYLYFAFNAMCMSISLIIAFYLLRKFGVSRRLSFFICVFISLNPGFVQVFNGVCFPERMQIFFISIFLLLLYKIFMQDRGNVLNIVLLLLFANFAIYSKEPTFIFFSAFGLVYILLNTIKNYKSPPPLPQSIKDNQARYYKYIALIGMIISGIIFFLLYLTLIYPNITSSYRGQFSSPFISMREYLAISLSSVFFNHPFLFLGLFISIMRFIKLVKNKFISNYLFLDSILFASSALMLGFIAIRALGFYYYSPIYFFFFLPTSVFLGRELYLASRNITKIAFYICIAIYLIGSLPFALSTFTQTKAFPVSYHKAVDFLVEYINTHDRVSIFMDGRPRDANGFSSFGRLEMFLDKKGVKNSFDLKTSEPNPKYVKSPANTKSKFSIYNSLDVSTPKSGDLICIDPDDFKYINSEYLEFMSKEYDLIFKSTFIGVPNLNIKAILKFLAFKINNKDVYGEYGLSSNFFRLPLGIYIYRVR